MTDVDNEMIEIFTEECTSILEELKEIRNAAVSAEEYSFDNIQDIFRSIHTLKADATMMFYENIAEISRSFESVLYFLRDEEKEIKDQSRFHYLLETFMDYVTTELGKIESGGETDGNNQTLLELIADYPLDENQKVTKLKDPFLDKITVMEEEVPVSEELAKKINSFYIPGNAPTEDENRDKDEKEPENYVVEDTRPKASEYIDRLREQKTDQEDEAHDREEEILPRKIEQYNRRKHTIVTEEDIDYLKQELQSFKMLVDSYKQRLKEVTVVGMTMEDLTDYIQHQKRLEHWIRQVTTTDFSQVAEKMQGVAREMTSRLHKKVDLVIVGEKTLIDKSKKEKLAAAMIHILRNAIDHGIEDAIDRRREGKSETGTVLINITRKKGEHIRIDISDDGRGLDTEKILQTAKEKGFLYKAKEEFTEKEIFELTMIPGFSTSSKISDYSGRGVGMDVVRHNIEEIGGTLKLHSKFGKGTKVSIFL